MGLYMLESLFRVSDLSGSMILILPLCFSVGSIINALLFIAVFEMDFGGIVKPLFNASLESLVASAVGGAVTYFILSFLPSIQLFSTLLKILSQALVAGGAGIAVWAVVLLLLQNEEFMESLTALRTRFAPKEPVVTEQIEL